LRRIDHGQKDSGDIKRAPFLNLKIIKEIKMADQSTSPQQIQINTGDELMRGRYSNSLIVSHSPEEFILDWLLNSPSGTFLVSRTIVSPGSLRKIINALTENLEKYERQYGPIKVIESGEQKFH
jgi:hypothetical protein